MGDYERDAGGTARIPGTVYSDKEGKVPIHSIYPRGYNDSPNGAHIHFVVRRPGYADAHAVLGFDDYHANRYDRKNLNARIVYLDKLEEKNGRYTGRATLYVQ